MRSRVVEVRDGAAVRKYYVQDARKDARLETDFVLRSKLSRCAHVE